MIQDQEAKPEDGDEGMIAPTNEDVACVHHHHRRGPRRGGVHLVHAFFPVWIYISVEHNAMCDFDNVSENEKKQ